MANLIEVPVFADATNEKLNKTLKLASLAYDATEDVGDITLMGTEVHFPSFKRVASVTTTEKGKELTASDVDLSDNVAKIKQCGGSVNVYDKDAKQVKGKMLDNMAQQMADAMAIDIDTSLVTTLDAEVTKKSALANAIAVTEDEMFNAYALFGDSVNVTDFSGIAIPSHLLPSFLKMDSFVSKEKTFTANGNGIINDNVVGFWLGIPVVLTNSCYDLTAKESKIYFIKNGALGYVMQEQPTIEVERQATFLRNVIVGSDMYATKVLNKEGIVVARKTIA